MAPIAPIGRKKRVSSPTTSLASPPPPAQQPSPAPQSPLHHISDGRITKNAKRALLENLELEIAERTRKLRSHYMLLSHSLKQRVEMRINRVPKKLWKITMGELMQQMDGNASFVGEVRSLSRGQTEPQPAPKPQRITKKAPTPALNPLALSLKSHLPPSSSSMGPPPSPRRPPSRHVSPVKDSSPVKLARARMLPKSTTPATPRAISRSTTRSSIETSATAGTMSSAIKVKAPEVKSLKRGGGVTGAGGGSNGSLKENRVAGVKTEAAATRAGRVLRSRK